ncbi:MAG: hypothetical protein AAFX85_16695 [Pseudomonadota bacterium]
MPALRNRLRPLPIEQDPFTDLLFNALLAFTFLFIVALIFLHPPTEQGRVDIKAEYLISATWGDNLPDDVDMWVEDPQGNVIWFNNPSAGFMHLDRDDRGVSNDMMLVDGEEVVNPLNQEVVTLRGWTQGEYVVNLHYYQSETDEPVTVSVRVARVNPVLEIAYYEDVTLERAGAEATAVRFSLDAEGRVHNVNTLSKSIVSVDSP